MKKAHRAIYSRPDPEVYRLAARRIENRVDLYSCHAVQNVLESVHGVGLHSMPYRDYCAVTHRYRDQYRQHAWGYRETPPSWWSSGRRYTKERVAALNAMADACEAAGRK